MEGLLDGLDIQRFGIYIQDYGAPVGTRIATRRPEAAVVEAFASPEGIKANWTAGARDPEGLTPDGWNMDRYFMAQPHRQRLQLELMYDYRYNPDHQPDAELHLLPTGHFALEEELERIAGLIRAFYATRVHPAALAAAQ
jgi:hypothetical protein